MPLNVRIIDAREFMQVEQDGRFNWEAAKHMLVKMAAASASPTDYEILIDLREAKWDLTGPEMWDVVAELASHTDSFRERIALLAKPGTGFDHAERLEICAQDSGRQVRAFTQFEDAVHWLFEGAALRGEPPN